jgi:aldehyde dehydrogenase
VVEQEQFGPTVPILRYDNVDDLINLLNRSQYGLGASFWTQDEDHAFELARRMDTGSVFVNSHSFTSLDPRAPFGGVKSSGLGREFSPQSLDAYTEPQTISRRFGPPGPPVE